MKTIAQHKEVTRVAVLIPAFCEEETVGEIVEKARRYLRDVIVVDDGSTDQTSSCAEAAGATVLRRAVNGGKGQTLTEGFKYILAQGFDAVITLDADGFHDPDEITKFLEAYQRTHIPVLIGNRMAEVRNVPLVRRWTVRTMCYWLDRLTHVYVPDPPCGFRFYRCDVLPFILDEESSLPSEFVTLLHIASRRIRIGFVRVARQPKRHKSLIAPLRDIIRFGLALTRYYKKTHKSRREGSPVRRAHGQRSRIKA